jgi:hypothetical protein
MAASASFPYARLVRARRRPLRRFRAAAPDIAGKQARAASFPARRVLVNFAVAAAGDCAAEHRAGTVESEGSEVVAAKLDMKPPSATGRFEGFATYGFAYPYVALRAAPSAKKLLLSHGNSIQPALESYICSTKSVMRGYWRRWVPEAIEPVRVTASSATIAKVRTKMIMTTPSF